MESGHIGNIEDQRQFLQQNIIVLAEEKDGKDEKG
jgi:hypothetical protein